MKVIINYLWFSLRFYTYPKSEASGRSRTHTSAQNIARGCCLSSYGSCAHGELMCGARVQTLLTLWESLTFQEVSEVLSCRLSAAAALYYGRAAVIRVEHPCGFPSGTMSTRYSPKCALLSAVCAHVVSVLTVCCAGRLFTAGKSHFIVIALCTYNFHMTVWLRLKPFALPV